MPGRRLRGARPQLRRAGRGDGRGGVGPLTPPPTPPLAGGHALVTGGGRGLGRAAAAGLAEAGAAVTLLARSADDLAAAVEELRRGGAEATAAVADVRDAEGLAAAIAAADARRPLTVLVTAAGVNRVGAAVDYPLADLDLLWEVNVRGTFAACQAFGRRLIERGQGGRIITISSQMGLVGYPGRSAYCSTKHAVNGMTKALGVEWAPHGIGVNAVAPTFVRTAMTEAALADAEFAAEVERRIPGGELATSDEVAAAVVYLASERARSVTGHVLAVDGGWTAW